jgi:hypothetical protein
MPCLFLAEPRNFLNANIIIPVEYSTPLNIVVHDPYQGAYLVAWFFGERVLAMKELRYSNTSDFTVFTGKALEIETPHGGFLDWGRILGLLEFIRGLKTKKN